MICSASDLRIDGGRLLARLNELAKIGADPNGGVTRLAYSAADIQARDLIARWMTQAGLQVWLDAAANLFGRLPGQGPASGAFVTGSHLDTVVRGGRLDGSVGVLAALAATEALQHSTLTMQHDLVVAVFCNEEGARGTPGMIGSKAVTGRLVPDDLTNPDAEGVTLAQRLRDAGGDPAQIARASWHPDQITAFLELHIEQGPNLETAGVQLGVVSHITGQIGITASIVGEANHAGTTPMSRRRDAAAAAARLILAVQTLAHDHHVRVATTGTIRIDPGIRNVIPGTAKLSIDIRDDSLERMTAAVDVLTGWASDIAADTGTSIQLRPGTPVPPVPADSELTRHIAAAAESLGATWLSVPSGAGHDAQIMASIAPMAMIFVPSIGGISHAPAEASAPEHLILGANTLLQTLITADASLPDRLRLSRSGTSA